MFTKKNRPGAGFAIMESELDPSPKYQKPKIMLVDIKDDAEVVLKKAGFNVTSGTFGTPYRYKKKTSTYL